MHPKVTGYAFINHPIPDLFKKLANDYIEKEYGTWIYRHKSNYYDIKTLNNLVNLDCMNCHLAHTRLCCEGSTPYPILENEREKIMAKSDEIFANTLTKEEYEKVSSIMEYHNAKPIIDDEGNFATPCNSCIFFNKFDNGSYGCSIHRHALNQKIPYTALKPSACLMYPLDVLTLDNGGYFLLGIDVGTVVDIYPYKKRKKLYME
ncbi:MAG TPA: hypothetical protein VK119_04245 [Bacillota bacterium]|nr:hypothetical protein [Bacillota bacterium]